MLMDPVDSNLTEVQQVSGGESEEDVVGPSVGPSVGPVGLAVDVLGDGGSGDKSLIKRCK